MIEQAFRQLSEYIILTVPGLDGSGPEHWQTHWERSLPRCERVQMGDWAFPDRAKWVRKLDQEIRIAPGSVILAAHSLGCLTVAWWAKERWSLGYRDRVVGALLVAPPDVERPGALDRIKGFSPAPREPLPFASLLVASRDDPFCRFETSERVASMWGSHFIDAGELGHINANSAIGEWEDGLRLLASLAPPVESGEHLWDWSEAIDLRQTFPERRRGSSPD